MSKEKTWSKLFGPSYTPWEMLDRGVFMDCHYNYAIEELPKEWYKHPKVFPRDKEPDVSENYYGVKSRQSLKDWQKKGWTTKDSPLGWWQWYVLYYFGRRLPEEDEKQIARWRSFVARHQGQINANCPLTDKACRPRQRQGLLQFAWNAGSEFTDKQIDANRKRISEQANVTLETIRVVSPSSRW